MQVASVKFLAVIALALLFAAPATAYAACLEPPGEEGLMIYNSSEKVLQYCDGDDWVAVQKGSGGIHHQAALGSGWEFACALGTDGSLTCWGQNDQGQTGSAPGGTDFIAVSGGTKHGCALRKDNSLTCWGGDGEGQVDDTPTSSDFAYVAAGDYHSCAVRQDKSVVCWGLDSDGQVSSAPGGNDLIAVQTGIDFSCALRDDGSLTCWGDNFYGQLNPPGGNDFVTLSKGYYHMCAIRESGDVECWGRNEEGERVPPSGAFQSVSGGWLHTCGIRVDGSLACWGRDDEGQSSPPAGNDFIAVQSGGFHSCAMRSNGSVICWSSENYNGIVSSAPGGSDFGRALGCFNPPGEEGMLRYNSAYKIMQYCDGDAWHAAGPANVSGSGGCVNPSGDEGQVVYNTTRKVLQYCDGGGWVSMKTVPSCPAEDLQAHWKLDEASGSTVFDYSGNGYNGTRTGTTRLPNGGIIDGAHQFAGTWNSGNPNRVELSTNNESHGLTLRGATTISAWISPDGNGNNYGAIIRHGKDVDMIYVFSARTRLSFDQYDGSDWLWVETGNILPFNEWSHVAAVREADGRTVRLYLNGDLVASDVLSAAPTSATPAAATIGGNNNHIEGAFGGKIDDLRVYSRDLDEDEIQTLAGICK